MPVDHKLENRTSAVPGLQTYDNRVYEDLRRNRHRVRRTNWPSSLTCFTGQPKIAKSPI